MKIACIYHSIDLDGWMSAAIVKHWFNETNFKEAAIGNTLPDNIDFVGYNYGQPIPDLSEYDRVIDLRKIEIPKEEWKIIKEYDNKFSISNWGRLKSNNYTVKNNNGYRSINGKILSQCINPDYPSVATNYGKFYIHQLVAKYFINNFENKLTINHKDGVKTNNIVTNLEWNTYKENQQHSILNELRKTGINNKKNIPIVKIDSNIETKYPSLTIAASENNLRISNIARALKNNIKCGGFNWRYDIETKIEHISQEIINTGSIIASCTTDNLSILELTWQYFFPNEEMPEIVRLLGRYDCFGHKTKSFEMSSDGYDKAKQYLKEVGKLKEFEDNKTSTDGYSLVHRANDVAKLLSEEQKVLEFQYGARMVIDSYNKAYEFLLSNINLGVHVCESIHIDGAAIYRYLCTEAKQVYKNGFEIELSYPIKKIKVDIDKIPGKNDTIFEVQVVPFKFICINKERFNPINFGIDYHADGYDGCACYYYDGKTKLWKWSLYNDNGLVDCSIIAKRYGGCGHKGAAGFMIKDISQIIKE